MLTLFVTGLEFYAYHGVPAEERVIGHRYIADLTLKVDGQADLTDDIEDTVDYAQVAQLVLETSVAKQYKTVERLAYVIAQALFDRFPRVQEVSIRLAKRLPPAHVIAEEIGVELELKRPL